MDNGPPEMFGTDWGEFSHTNAIQLVHAPKSAPYQNGLADRVVRPPKAELRDILTTGGDRASQRIRTQAVMARNDVHHTVTGIPQAMGMTRRCDLLSGRASAAWSNNPVAGDPAVQQADAMRNILTARTAVVAADADRALKTCLPRNLPGLSSEFYPIGPQVQLASRGSRSGTWKVIGHASINLILIRRARRWRRLFCAKTNFAAPIMSGIFPACDSISASLDNSGPKCSTKSLNIAGIYIFANRMNSPCILCGITLLKYFLSFFSDSPHPLGNYNRTCFTPISGIAPIKVVPRSRER